MEEEQLLLPLCYKIHCCTNSRFDIFVPVFQNYNILHNHTTIDFDDAIDFDIDDDICEVSLQPKKRQRRKHYINNVHFHEAMVEWKESLSTNKSTPIPDYIGECFIKLAENRAKHPWYNGWTFKDEMIAEAIYTCCKYAYNYNHIEFSNPFAYFTQYINNAFSQVKAKEKKIADYKFERIKEMQTNNADYDYNNFFNEEVE